MRIVVVAVLVLVIGTSVGAQAPGSDRRAAPTRISVTTIQLRPDKAHVWDELMETEAVPALKKAGVPWQQVWMSGAFGPDFARMVVQPMAGYAQFDGPDPYERALGKEQAARLAARLAETVVESRTMAMTLRKELTIDSGSAPGPLAQVSFRQTHVGKAAEFVRVMAQDFLPNFRKTGIKDYFVYQSSYGAPNGLFMIVRPLPSYAALEAPSMMSQTLGSEAAAPAYDRFNPLQSSSQFDILRLSPALTF